MDSSISLGVGDAERQELIGRTEAILLHDKRLSSFDCCLNNEVTELSTGGKDAIVVGCPFYYIYL